MFCPILLHCVAVCCSVTSCTRRDDQFFAALCCSVLQCVAVCCSVLQCVAVCCSVLQCNLVHTKMRSFLAISVLHSLHSVAFCCSVCCLLLQSLLPSFAVWPRLQDDQTARPYESCINTLGLTPPSCPFGTGTTVVRNISPDHDGRVEMKNPTRMSNKTSTA